MTILPIALPGKGEERVQRHLARRGAMDLGAEDWQTFRHVTLPVVATALVAGGLFAFGLSCDEVIVTRFTAGAQNTPPSGSSAIRQGQSLPQTNVVVLLVIASTFIAVVLAQRLTRDTGVLRGAGAH